MKGARLPPGSVIKAMNTAHIQKMLFLPVGELIIERDGYGNSKTEKLKERPRVKVQFVNKTGIEYHKWDPAEPRGQASWEADVDVA